MTACHTSVRLHYMANKIQAAARFDKDRLSVRVSMKFSGAGWLENVTVPRTGNQARTMLL